MASKVFKSAKIPAFDGRSIVVRGAREHNLKNVDLTIPRDKLVVFTGLSGSGKSSLAFDTIYAEGQRRYVESLSAYARQFLEMMPEAGCRPDRRSVAGDLHRAENNLEEPAFHRWHRHRNLTTTCGFCGARVGIPYSPATGLPIESQTVSQMVDRLLALPERTRLYLLAPVDPRPQGRIPQGDRRLHEARLPAPEDRRSNFTRSPTPRPSIRSSSMIIDVVVDRHRRCAPDIRAPAVSESFETALELADGHRLSPNIADPPDKESGGAPKRIVFSAKFACPCLRLYHPRDRAPALLVQQRPSAPVRLCSGLG